MDDFEWIREVDEPIIMTGRKYVINFTGSSMTANDLEFKFVELFGREIISEIHGARFCNWFDNHNMIEREGEGRRYILLLDIGEGRNLWGSHEDNPEDIDGGWDEEDTLGRYVGYQGYEEITPQEFLRMVRIEVTGTKKHHPIKERGRRKVEDG